MSAAAYLDQLTAEESRAALLRCCGSTRWASAMMAKRPFGTNEALFAAAEATWANMGPSDVREALAHHPRIGEDPTALRAKFASTATWAAGEQGAVRQASEATLRALQEGNRAYEATFGHTFVVCATGKSAEEMLALLQGRLGNAAEVELQTAAAEQAKITRLRLEKLCP